MPLLIVMVKELRLKIINNKNIAGYNVSEWYSLEEPNKLFLSTWYDILYNYKTLDFISNNWRDFYIKILGYFLFCQI